jgi:hypothetical protein
VNSGGTNDGAVSVINLASKQVVATIPTSGFGGNIVMRPDGAQAVAVVGFSKLAVIDVATNRIAKTLQMPCTGTTLYGLAYTPDGSKIVLPDLSDGCTSNGLRIVTVATGTTQFTAISGTGPGVAIMPNGTSALISGGVTGTQMKRVNLSTLAVTNITGTGATYGVAITPDNGSAVVGAYNDGIKRVDLTTNTISSVNAFTGSEVAITPDGAKAVVVGDFNTAVLQLSTNATLATYSTLGSRVAITPDGKYALITQGAGSGLGGTIRIIRIP